jgi:hypothetical protein
MGELGVRADGRRRLFGGLNSIGMAHMVFITRA